MTWAYYIKHFRHDHDQAEKLTCDRSGASFSSKNPHATHITLHDSPSDSPGLSKIKT